MNVLLLGSGGREHALAWKLSQSPLCAALYVAPGNAGTAEVATNLSVDPNDFDGVRAAVLEHQVRMIVCGPEAPLVRGLQDYCSTDPELNSVYFIGPSKEAARVEGSKAYAKAFMEEYGIPTAAYRRFTADELTEATNYLSELKPPYVLKADGLAAGKGVVIAHKLAEAERALRELLGGRFGEASSTVVIEEFLEGTEFSVFVLTDGESYRILPVAKDYKRVGEGDSGPNTGGMGSVSHPPFVDADLMRKVEQQVIQPTLRGIQARKLDYRGFVFLGLIVGRNGEPQVIEYNCRMGDPETQSVMLRLESDLMQLLLHTAEGNLSTSVVQIRERHAATVVLTSGGYPGDYEKGKNIAGLDHAETSARVFVAGAARGQQGRWVTAGGRVLGVSALGDSVEEALRHCYERIEGIDFAGMHYRKDIGFDL